MDNYWNKEEKKTFVKLFIIFIVPHCPLESLYQFTFTSAVYKRASVSLPNYYLIQYFTSILSRLKQHIIISEGW